MQIAKTIQELRGMLTSRDSVGFVPTMGYLHEGHKALVDAAKEHCQTIVLSIFVNPLQFGPNEDLDRYPRDKAGDLAKAEQWGVDVVFIPNAKEMYPREQQMSIDVTQDLTDKLCGRTRPGHFNGVATVVLKLSQIVRPDKMFFGMKDAQQVAVVKRLVDDFHLGIEIIGVETVREPDGLAKSSRNVYLNDEERSQAVVLYQTLEEMHRRLDQDSSGLTWGELLKTARQRIASVPLAQIDYVECLTWPDLSRFPEDEMVTEASGEVIMALAIYFGKTRLIDNQIWTVPSGGEWNVS